MASSKEFVQFIMAQLSDLENVSHRAMMGEYVVYYGGKVIGGIYNDRLLVKAVKSAIDFTPEPCFVIPYEGAKEMLLVSDVDNKEFLINLFKVMYDDLPAPKPKKKKQ